mmetsp:Transcript_20022/g.50479  ORF Transcript_20022/g.50479 Transcript_20022/m.50479 type:complete len:611 (+) Transcript_20022:816-2648(+)
MDGQDVVLRGLHAGAEDGRHHLHGRDLQLLERGAQAVGDGGQHVRPQAEHRAVHLLHRAAQRDVARLGRVAGAPQLAELRAGGGHVRGALRQQDERLADLGADVQAERLAAAGALHLAVQVADQPLHLRGAGDGPGAAAREGGDHGLLQLPRGGGHVGLQEWRRRVQQAVPLRPAGGRRGALHVCVADELGDDGLEQQREARVVLAEGVADEVAATARSAGGRAHLRHAVPQQLGGVAPKLAHQHGLVLLVKQVHKALVRQRVALLLEHPLQVPHRHSAAVQLAGKLVQAGPHLLRVCLARLGDGGAGGAGADRGGDLPGIQRGLDALRQGHVVLRQQLVHRGLQAVQVVVHLQRAAHLRLAERQHPLGQRRLRLRRHLLLRRSQKLVVHRQEVDAPEVRLLLRLPHVRDELGGLGEVQRGAGRRAGELLPQLGGDLGAVQRVPQQLGRLVQVGQLAGPGANFLERLHHLRRHARHRAPQASGAQAHPPQRGARVLQPASVAQQVVVARGHLPPDLVTQQADPRLQLRGLFRRRGPRVRQSLARKAEAVKAVPQEGREAVVRQQLRHVRRLGGRGATPLHSAPHLGRTWNLARRKALYTAAGNHGAAVWQ